jgi:hypothetical protein
VFYEVVKSTDLFDGFQATTACPSDKSGIKDEDENVALMESDRRKPKYLEQSHDFKPPYTKIHCVPTKNSVFPLERPTDE